MVFNPRCDCRRHRFHYTTAASGAQREDSPFGVHAKSHGISHRDASICIRYIAGRRRHYRTREVNDIKSVDSSAAANVSKVEATIVTVVSIAVAISSTIATYTRSVNHLWMRHHPTTRDYLLLT